MNARPQVVAALRAKPMHAMTDCKAAPAFHLDGVPLAPLLTEALQEAWHAIDRGIRPAIQAATARALALGARMAHCTSANALEELDAIAAIAATWGDDATHATLQAQAVLRRSPSTRIQAELIRTLKIGYWRSRDFESLYRLYAAHRTPTQLSEASTEAGHLSIDAAIEADQLRLKSAERLAKAALALCEASVACKSPISSLSRCLLAHIAYEVGDVAQADAMLRGQLSLIEQSGSIESALFAFDTSANIAFAGGNDSLAFSILRQAELTGKRLGWKRLALQSASHQATLHIYQDRLDLAEDAMFRCRDIVSSPDHGINGVADTWPFTIAMLHFKLATKDASLHVSSELEHHIQRSVAQRHPAVEIRLRQMLACALNRAGRPAEADVELVNALHRGCEAGLYRSFVDHLPMIEEHLQRLHKRSIDGSLHHLSAYIDSLLPEPAVTRITREVVRLPIVLSKKETAVLHLIRLGLSNKSIAREMHVAPETVKSHVKRVFIKLASRTRAEAVSRAQDLGFI
ncbi:LuxR C-terminal-related transcriptional regulator [Dyella sp. RRB7]|uniref:LuxR C-terminal-related transcriptional regulator n=1 Tax=Dyella sp. RRB7 TaxID=2919502 RepID=UPI001FA98790|nr:LuxR C-terminal-related transcriptional regulator [Dyella sp. RRB7]